MTIYCQLYEQSREKFKEQKEKKEKVARDLQKQRDLNKPLQDKKDAAAEREKELGAKVEIKVRE